MLKNWYRSFLFFQAIIVYFNFLPCAAIHLIQTRQPGKICAVRIMSLFKNKQKLLLYDDTRLLLLLFLVILSDRSGGCCSVAALLFALLSLYFTIFLHVVPKFHTAIHQSRKAFKLVLVGRMQPRKTHISYKDILWYGLFDFRFLHVLCYKMLPILVSLKIKYHLSGVSARIQPRKL